MSLSNSFQLYCKAGEKQLARQVFDRSRSIDPGLALPWASMSTESCMRYYSLVSFILSFSRSMVILSIIHRFSNHMPSLYSREPAPDEAFESCSRAVQIMPVIY